MARASLQNLPIFLDEDLQGADETLHLNHLLLMGAISPCKSVESVYTLRRSIAEIKRRLSDAGDSLRSDNGDGQLVEFAKSHLVAELDQIAGSLSVERAQYYVERLLKGISETVTSPINDINLNRWKEYDDIYTDSLWLIDRRDNSGVHAAGYWGNFVPQIPHQTMLRYTKKGDWVLDTFAGSGTTLIEGQRLGRNTIGIELQFRMVEQARNLVASEPNRYNITSDIICSDCVTADYQAILGKHGQRSVQLVVMHPPYHDIIKFSDDPRDLSNASCAEEFLTLMGRAVANAMPFLDEGRYLVLVIGDKYSKGEWIPLGFLTMNEILRLGFSLKSIVVKNFEDTAGKRNQKELWRYRALVGGFYIFKHEYIFVLRKGRAR